MPKGQLEKKKDEVEPGLDPWMMTYGDLMTQILIFFVMLFSMSTISEIKVQAVSESLREAFGFEPTTLEEDIEEPSMIQVYAAKLRSGSLSHGVIGEHLHVETIDKGIKISIGGKVLFDKHRAEIRSEAYGVLSEIADFIRGYDTRVEVIGHCGTDPVPPDSIFKDKQKLSYERAYNVSLYLQKSRIRGNRFLVSGADQYQPAEQSLFKESADRNRRVELIITEERVRYELNLE